MDNTDELKKSTIKSAALESLLQIGLRIVSSVLNAFVVRHVSGEVFAIMFVRLHLLYDTGILLSREAFRRAALSAKPRTKLHKLVNLVWIGSLVSLPISGGGWYIWTYTMSEPPIEVTSHYGDGVLLMIASVVLEVMAEVPFVLAELQLMVKTKVAIEGLTHLVRSVLLAVFIYYWTGHAVLLYGISHLLGSMLYVVSYYGTFFYILKKKRKQQSEFYIESYHQLFPSISNKKLEVDEDLGIIAWSFFKQGWLKEVLTKGEWYLMNFFPLISLAQQGIYQVVNNLGSLVARLVFRSIEAASYKYFAQMMKRGIPIQHQDSAKMLEASKFLFRLYRSLMLISFIIVTFGWPYSHTLLKIYGGSKLSDGIGTDLMRAQCFFVVLLAVNGVSEAYTFAVMSDNELALHNKLLIAMSAAYILVSYGFTQTFGAFGFILANCTNMLLRICHSFWYIRSKYKGTLYAPLDGVFVPGEIVAVFVGAFSTMVMSEMLIYPTSLLLHIGLGGLTLLVVLYFLKWELKPFYERTLRLIESLLIFLSRLKIYFPFRSVLIGESLNSPSCEEFSQVKVVAYIYRLLYNNA